jgi:hypothetical protein
MAQSSVVPLEWYIQIRRDGEVYVIEFEKVMDMGSADPQFTSLVRGMLTAYTDTLRKMFGTEIKTNLADEGRYARLNITMRAPLDWISDLVVSEFLATSTLNEYSLAEILYNTLLVFVFRTSYRVGGGEGEGKS